MATPSTSATISDQIFNLIQQQQAQFPFPASRRTFIVGTFDAATGNFAYSVPTYRETIEAEPGGPLKPVTMTGGQIDAMNIIDVVLSFKVRNRQGEFVASVDGEPSVRTSTADGVEVDIGAASAVSFTLSCAGRTFRSELSLEINRITAGAGVFTLPAFPIAIIYAPPADKRQKNVSQWSVTDTTGNTTSFSFGSAQSTGHPAPTQFDDITTITSGMKGLSTALGKIKNPYAQAASTALGLIAGALGTASATETTGTAVNSQHSLTVSLTNHQTITAGASTGGPGAGDLIYYLKNVKLAWLANSAGPLRVTVFGHDGIGVTSVGFLNGGGHTDLDAATVKALLALDPFVANGPSAVLTPGRFVYLDTIDINGTEINTVETYTVSTQDQQQTTNTITELQNDKTGILNWIGLGVSDDNTTQSTLSQSSNTQSTNSHTVSNSIDLFAQADERYSVEIYADVVFGTFAYRPVATSQTPLLAGTAFTSVGKPSVNQIVTLLNNGRKFTTRTDSAGRYAFHAKTINTGKSVLQMGSVRLSFQFTPGLTHDLR